MTFGKADSESVHLLVQRYQQRKTEAQEQQERLDRASAQLVRINESLSGLREALALLGVDADAVELNP